jgi:type I restriction-modification system DNA methylase subunit|tara:strand:+ start:2037 stop:2396 length:360 start_codon:yes stop_codon:yes gene_type:complete
MLHQVKTNEVFTPTKLVNEILSRQPKSLFASGKTVLDPACGDGQFLIAVKQIKMEHFKMSETDALKDIYGVDIVRDYVDQCKKRLGGGNIIMGNTLKPNIKLDEQTEQEHRLMLKWFYS